ncbi:hypothetical protein CR969_01540 [Candidatus Saccharibacteria bacterium]|nr:MAG: hypothetical protein CR969_01540 [Candidatus Saccharibacteria bacterium]
MIRQPTEPKIQSTVAPGEADLDFCVESSEGIDDVRVYDCESYLLPLVRTKHIDNAKQALSVARDEGASTEELNELVDDWLSELSLDWLVRDDGVLVAQVYDGEELSAPVAIVARPDGFGDILADVRINIIEGPFETILGEVKTRSNFVVTKLSEDYKERNIQMRGGSELSEFLRWTGLLACKLNRGSLVDDQAIIDLAAETRGNMLPMARDKILIMNHSLYQARDGLGYILGAIKEAGDKFAQSSDFDENTKQAILSAVDHAKDITIKKEGKLEASIDEAYNIYRGIKQAIDDIGDELNLIDVEGDRAPDADVIISEIAFIRRSMASLELFARYNLRFTEIEVAIAAITSSWLDACSRSRHQEMSRGEE